MQKEHHQLLIVHVDNEEEEEEVEGVSLKRTLPHGKDNLVTCVVTSSSSSSTSSPASNGVCTVATDPNGSSLQKEEEVEEIRNVGENSNHFNDDCAAVGLGLVSEFVGAETNGYGGAITVEPITSLGIVSSAASSGATPSNITGLGFANLIGGLLVLGHNLKDLKNGLYRGQPLQTNAQHRYQEQLGRRENFLLHAVAAVLSFLIFSSVPLVIYGLLINKNYYAEVKFTIVAATSVVCIILLAIGKVYTRRPPKSYIKTVLYYVTTALAISGLSYMAGNLFKDLLEKFNHFVLIVVISCIGIIYRLFFKG